MLPNDVSIYIDVLESISESIYVLDKYKNFIYVNRELINITGYSRKEFLNYSVPNLIKDGVINKSVSEIVDKEKRPVTIFQDFIRKDNSILKMMVTSTPILDENGNNKYYVAIVRNIDKLNKIYNDVAKQNEVLTFNVRYRELEAQKIIAESLDMKKILNTVEKIAEFNIAVIISGDSGTGKEVIANYIHRKSDRKNKEMMKINCASLPENLLEAELFGYEKGAFTGALKQGKKGLIEEAENSTLFLDEINSLPYKLQGKLLRILETKELKRIGSNRTRYIDFRLIAATNTDLEQLVKDNKFRKDLYYRLNVIPITIPPLKDRKEDIIPLCDYFLNYYNKKYNKVKKLSKNIYNIMLEYEWPGNVRELKNLIERMLVMSSNTVVEIKDIPRELITNHQYAIDNKDSKLNIKDYVCYSNDEIIKNNIFIMNLNNVTSYKNAINQFEKALLINVLERFNNTYKAAEALKLDQSTIVRKKKKLL